jgi:hypothetical protein
MINKISVAALAVSLVTMAGLTTACNWGGAPDNGNGTCTITARDTTTITTKCVDNNGQDNGNGKVLNEPSDLYPQCQIEHFWPDCKYAK